MSNSGNIYSPQIDYLLNSYIPFANFQIVSFDLNESLTLIEEHLKLPGKYVTKDLVGVKVPDDTCLLPFMNHAPDITYVFSTKAFYTLHDLVVLPENSIQMLCIEGIPLYMYVFPASPTYCEPFPLYRTISEILPPNMHYFCKFSNSPYLLVTEKFKQRWKEQKLKGASFLLKWDGKQAYPKI